MPRLGAAACTAKADKKIQNDEHYALERMLYAANYITCILFLRSLSPIRFDSHRKFIVKALFLALFACTHILLFSLPFFHCICLVFAESNLFAAQTAVIIIHLVMRCFRCLASASNRSDKMRTL